MKKLACGLRLRQILSLILTALCLVALGSNLHAAGQSDSDRLQRLEETVRLLLIQNAELRKHVDELRGDKISLPKESKIPAGASNEFQIDSKPGFATLPAAEIKPSSNTDVVFYWENGLGFKTADEKTFEGKLGGRIHYDVATFDQDAGAKEIAGDAPFATELRRARFYTTGDLNLGVPVFYKTQVEFAGSDYKFADVYVGLKDIPYLGVLQLGQQYEPFSLEQLTSSTYFTFIERAAPIEAFSPGRNIGAQLRDSMLRGRATWAVGVYADDQNNMGDNDSFDSSTHVTGRITALPWYDEASGGSRYWHLGAGGSVINPENETVRFRSRPEAHLAPRYADTKDFNGTDLYLSNVESALTLNSLSLQAEYFLAQVNAAAGPNPSFDGLYIFGSWFLTGEHRPYDQSEGSIDRVKPIRNFSFDDSGFGALEFALRYSRLNLNDESIIGGKFADYSVGLNWYLNSNARAMLNYIFSDLERGSVDGKSQSVQARFHMDY